jgi:branched-chain amino acid transport system permease protein
VQLTVYSLILIAVILWRPSGLIGVFTDLYQRIAYSGASRAKEVPLDG